MPNLKSIESYELLSGELPKTPPKPPKETLKIEYLNGKSTSLITPDINTSPPKNPLIGDMFVDIDTLLNHYKKIYIFTNNGWVPISNPHKKIIIKNCNTCIHIRKWTDHDQSHCNETCKKIDDNMTIPKWCPLPTD